MLIGVLTIICVYLLYHKLASTNLDVVYDSDDTVIVNDP